MDVGRGSGLAVPRDSHKRLMQQTMRILVADDHDLLRDTLVVYLQTEASFDVESVGNFAEASEAVRSRKPYDLVLLDFSMPGMIGLDGLSTMLEQADAPPIALISGVASREVAQRALEAGAMGFLPKTLSATDLVKAVNLMIEGTRYMPAEFKLPRPDGKAAPDALLGQLSQRELQVWHGLSRGKSNKEIARDLEVQETTVKLHVKTLYRKLGVANRTQAAILATEHGVF